MNRLDRTARVGDAQKCVPKLSDDEKVLASFAPVQMFVAADGAEQPTSAGVGALHVTDKNIIWLSGTDADAGYSIRTRDISMHALSRDTASFPAACLYAHVDDAAGTTECRFVPPNTGAQAQANPKMLDEMYNAFSKSAELNPDAPADGDDEEGDFFFSDAEVRGNLNALTLSEQKQQDVLLAQFNAVKPAGAAAQPGAATGAAAAAAGAGAAAAAAASADDAKAKAKQQQTLAKMNALFDALPEPTPQLAAALANHNAATAAAAAAGVPQPPMTKPGTAVAAAPAGAYDDADDDDDAPMS